MKNLLCPRKRPKVRKIISLFILLCFSFSVLSSPAGAQVLPIVTAVSATQAFQPPVLLGLKVHPDNPLLFDFIVDQGQAKLTEEQLKAETEKLVKYFLAALTIPDKEVWVNLSPTEADRIIPDVLAQTVMGKTMLEQDYELKQLAASLTNPDEKLGQEYWNKVRAKAGKNAEIETSTMSKVWIVPAKAEVLESNGIVLVGEKRLKIMMADEYEKKETQSVSSEIFRSTILPNIEKEVNEGKTFADVRQIYNSVILAAWYKQALKESLLGKIYADKSKVAGVETDDKEIKQRVYQQYLEAFKKGAYNLIKEEEDPTTGDLIPRKYFSGGIATDFGEGASSALIVRAASPAEVAGGMSARSSSLSVVQVIGAETGAMPKKNRGASSSASSDSGLVVRINGMQALTGRLDINSARFNDDGAVIFTFGAFQRDENDRPYLRAYRLRSKDYGQRVDLLSGRLYQDEGGARFEDGRGGAYAEVYLGPRHSRVRGELVLETEGVLYPFGIRIVLKDGTENSFQYTARIFPNRASSGATSSPIQDIFSASEAAVAEVADQVISDLLKQSGGDMEIPVSVKDIMLGVVGMAYSLGISQARSWYREIPSVSDGYHLESMPQEMSEIYQRYQTIFTRLGFREIDLSGKRTVVIGQRLIQAVENRTGSINSRIQWHLNEIKRSGMALNIQVLKLANAILQGGTARISVFTRGVENLGAQLARRAKDPSSGSLVDFARRWIADFAKTNPVVGDAWVKSFAVLEAENNLRDREKFVPSFSHYHLWVLEVVGEMAKLGLDGTMLRQDGMALRIAEGVIEAGDYAAAIKEWKRFMGNWARLEQNPVNGLNFIRETSEYPIIGTLIREAIAMGESQGVSQEGAARDFQAAIQRADQILTASSGVTRREFLAGALGIAAGGVFSDAQAQEEKVNLVTEGPFESRASGRVFYALKDGPFNLTGAQILRLTFPPEQAGVKFFVRLLPRFASVDSPLHLNTRIYTVPQGGGVLDIPLSDFPNSSLENIRQISFHSGERAWGYYLDQDKSKQAVPLRIETVAPAAASSGVNERRALQQKEKEFNKAVLDYRQERLRRAYQTIVWWGQGRSSSLKPEHYLQDVEATLRLITDIAKDDPARIEDFLGFVETMINYAKSGSKGDLARIGGLLTNNYEKFSEYYDVLFNEEVTVPRVVAPLVSRVKGASFHSELVRRADVVLSDQQKAEFVDEMSSQYPELRNFYILEVMAQRQDQRKTGSGKIWNELIRFTRAKIREAKMKDPAFANTRELNALQRLKEEIAINGAAEDLLLTLENIDPALSRLEYSRMSELTLILREILKEYYVYLWGGKSVDEAMEMSLDTALIQHLSTVALPGRERMTSSEVGAALTMIGFEMPQGLPGEILEPHLRMTLDRLVSSSSVITLSEDGQAKLAAVRADLLGKDDRAADRLTERLFLHALEQVWEHVKDRNLRSGYKQVAEARFLTRHSNREIQKALTVIARDLLGLSPQNDYFVLRVRDDSFSGGQRNATYFEFLNYLLRTGWVSPSIGGVPEALAEANSVPFDGNISLDAAERLIRQAGVVDRKDAYVPLSAVLTFARNVKNGTPESQLYSMATLAVALERLNAWIGLINGNEKLSQEYSDLLKEMNQGRFSLKAVLSNRIGIREQQFGDSPTFGDARKQAIALEWARKEIVSPEAALLIMEQAVRDPEMDVPINILESTALFVVRNKENYSEKSPVFSELVRRLMPARRLSAQRWAQRSENLRAQVNPQEIFTEKMRTRIAARVTDTRNQDIVAEAGEFISERDAAVLLALMKRSSGTRKAIEYDPLTDIDPRDPNMHKILQARRFIANQIFGMWVREDGIFQYKLSPSTEANYPQFVREMQQTYALVKLDAVIPDIKGSSALMEAVKGSIHEGMSGKSSEQFEQNQQYLRWLVERDLFLVNATDKEFQPFREVMEAAEAEYSAMDLNMLGAAGQEFHIVSNVFDRAIAEKGVPGFWEVFLSLPSHSRDLSDWDQALWHFYINLAGSQPHVFEEGNLKDMLSEMQSMVIHNVRAKAWVREALARAGVTPEFVESLAVSSAAVENEVSASAPTAWGEQDAPQDPFGGIDFDASNMNLQIKRDGNGVPLPLPQQKLEGINIEGLFPVIINIMPVTPQSLPIFLGMAPASSEEGSPSVPRPDPAREPELAAG